MKTLLGAVLCSLCLGAAAPLVTSGQAEARQAAGADNYLQAANVITTAIDRYEMGVIWEASSPVMKASTPQDRFVSNIAQRRAQLGSIRHREWSSVRRVPLAQASGSLPAGQYVSVSYATTGQNGRVMEEVVSFHLDTDGQWRLVGYALN